MSKEELKYLIALSLVPNIGPVRAKNLVSYCGGVMGIFKAGKKELCKIPGIGNKHAESLLSKTTLKRADEEIEWAEKNNVKVLSYLDDEYPYRLKNTYDNPLILYYKGNSELNHPKIIGIVGTRKATDYGKKAVQKIIEAVKAYNPLILSGLAYGIDIEAHKTALDEGLETLAVMGHGMHTVYPSVHNKIAKKMIEQGGLLTEFMSGSKFEKENFPKRNRIVAGMLDALIVVETKRKGGSMITAEIAFNNNRDVFAVPGNFDRENSEGCNYLIGSLKAQILDNPTKLPELLAWGEIGDKPMSRQFELPLDISEEEKKILSLIKESNEISIDQLSVKSKLSNSHMASKLLELEFKGLIIQLPGKIYRLS